MCEFCETYLFAKQSAKERKKEFGINITLKVILTEISTKNRVRKGALDSMPMKLVYCPSCGKKLSELK